MLSDVACSNKVRAYLQYFGELPLQLTADYPVVK